MVGRKRRMASGEAEIDERDFKCAHTARYAAVVWSSRRLRYGVPIVIQKPAIKVDCPVTKQVLQHGRQKTQVQVHEGIKRIEGSSQDVRARNGTPVVTDTVTGHRY